jgi:hypothetical protein
MAVPKHLPSATDKNEQAAYGRSFTYCSNEES